MPAAAVLALLGLVPFLPGFLGAERADARRQALRATDANAEAPRASGSAPLRVFALGDSLLRRAVWADEAMERAGRAHGLDLTWRLLGRGGFDWDSAAVLEAAAAARPDLLIVESSKLFYTPRAASPPKDPFLLYPARPEESSARPFRFLRYVRGMLEPRRMVERTLAGHRNSMRRRYAAPDARYLRVFADAARRGTQVIVLETPLHPVARSILAEPAETDRVLRTLEAERVVLVWRCPLSFDALEFLDHRHLGAPGRARYSEWILDRLRGWRAAHPARPEPRTTAAR